jgi:hypothetical protein
MPLTPGLSGLVVVDGHFRFERGRGGFVEEHVGGQGGPVLQPQPRCVVEKAKK